MSESVPALRALIAESRVFYPLPHGAVPGWLSHQRVRLGDALEKSIQENERLSKVIADAVALCRTMDRGVGYRVSGDHSTWGEYTEGKSDFAGEIEELLTKAVKS